jgi:hypothetical protein
VIHIKCNENISILKGKFDPKTGHEGPEGMHICLYLDVR